MIRFVAIANGYIARAFSHTQDAKNVRLASWPFSMWILPQGAKFLRLRLAPRSPKDASANCTK
jgi:hypothetical protein